MDERKKRIQEGEQRENEIYDLIYALIGNDTPESDKVLDQMRQMPGLGWYVRRVEDSLSAYAWAAKQMIKNGSDVLVFPPTDAGDRKSNK